MPPVVLDHPLAGAWLTELRDHTTVPRRFRELVRLLTMALTWEATRTVGVEPVEIRTPLASMTGTRISDRTPLLVPVLRAGAWMVDAALAILPDADVGVIGMSRDEHTLQPATYVDRLPSTIDADRPVYVLDPMVATGGSLSAVGDLLRMRGVQRAAVLAILCAPEGLERVEADLPTWQVVTAAVDDRLDDRGFIVPGLGDAGDRLCG